MAMESSDGGFRCVDQLVVEIELMNEIESSLGWARRRRHYYRQAVLSVDHSFAPSHPALGERAQS